ncbi:MAG: PTS sugar transporter subunit IIA [Candidatus Lindowbacteria bacterium]|nr:PTS sugar transporter subunit IIA [Candidatus Lindowbacteria bacterium]
MDFGHLLKTLRISGGVSLRELSRSINVSPTYLSLVENGKQAPPNAARIAQIEEALRVPHGALLAATNNVDSEVALFLRHVPEVVDFLKVAKESAMGSEDFMELIGFLNSYGWQKMRGVLEKASIEPFKSPSENRGRPVIGPHVWPFLSEKLIFDMSGLDGKKEFFEEIVNRMTQHLDGLNRDEMIEELVERESIASTGIGDGIAVPHAYVSGLNRMVVALARIQDGLDFDSIDDEPVYMVLLLAGPLSSKNLHLRLLGRITKLLSYKNFCESVFKAGNPQEVIALFRSTEMRIP